MPVEEEQEIHRLPPTMDKTTTTQQARNARAAIAASNVPKQLAFHLQIGKRGPFGARLGTTLLITNCHGVWSLRRRLYVKKTRFHRFYLLKKKAAAVEKLHAALRRPGMRSWPEYDERVALLRKKLADAYWAAAPAPYMERAAGYLRAARRHRLGRRVCVCVWAAMFAALGLFVASWSALVPARIMVLYIAFCVCLFYKFVVDLWRFTFHEPDVIVCMLERV